MTDLSDEQPVYPKDGHSEVVPGLTGVCVNAFLSANMCVHDPNFIITHMHSPAQVLHPQIGFSQASKVTFAALNAMMTSSSILYSTVLCYQTAQLAEFRSRNQFESYQQGTSFDMANSLLLLLLKYAYSGK